MAESKRGEFLISCSFDELKMVTWVVREWNMRRRMKLARRMGYKLATFGTIHTLQWDIAMNSSQGTSIWKRFKTCQ